jgi:hypothetical protein
MGGDQLQPGVEDGGTPTEVVAQENKKILKRRKQENTKTSADAQQRLWPHRPWFVCSAKLNSTATWFPHYTTTIICCRLCFCLLSSLL